MSLRFYAYSFPFSRPFKTAAKHFSHRKGIILQLEKGSIQALGEIAPLPEFSLERIEEVERQLEKYKKRITDFFLSDFTLNQTVEFIRSHSFFPSVEFGLFTLAINYLAQQKNCSLQNLLSDNAPQKVLLNAVISLQAKDFNTRIAECLARGFTTVKIKADYAWDDLYPKLKKLRRSYPDIKIRIDANQSWPMEKARRYLHEMEKLNIEYCEEPLKDPTAHSISTLREETHIPIALDESLAHSFSLDDAFEITPVLILKPMVLGLSAMTKDLRKKAKRMNTKLIFTTSLESGVGRLMTATTAACFGSPQSAHGLNTGTLLQSDVWNDDQFIEQARYHLPDAKMLSKLMNQNFGKPEYKLISFNG